jgi:hypothetical protein
LASGALDSLGHGAGLIERLDRARAADHHDPVAADVHAADRDHRVVRFRLPADELVGMRDRDDLLDAGEVLENERIRLAAVAGNADRGAERAGDRVGAEPQPFDVADDGFDLFGPRRGFHDDEHADSPGRARPESMSHPPALCGPSV